MELPSEIEKVPRIIDGEMMYLDNSRRQKVEPVPYDMLTEMAVNRYETEADMYRAQGITPDIFGEYEQADERADPLCRQAIALADAFLAHRRPEI